MRVVVAVHAVAAAVAAVHEPVVVQVAVAVPLHVHRR